MPNRTLRGEGFRGSEAVSGLTDPAFRFYVLLLTFHEDFGRFDARPTFLRSNLFPYRIDRAREADISRWMAECQTAGLIVLYGPESKAYGVVTKTARPRAMSPLYPEPPAGIHCWRARPDKTCVFTSETVCEQTHANESVCAQLRPYSITNSITNSSLSYSIPPPAGEGEKKRSGTKALIDNAMRRSAK